MLPALAQGLLGAAILAVALLGETSGRTLGILLPALLLAASLSASSAGLALTNRGLAPRRREFLVPAALFVTALALAAWRGSDPGTAQLGLLEWGTGTLVAAVLAGWAGPRAAGRAGSAVAAAGAALAVYALYQRGWGLAFVAKAFEANPGLAGPAAALPGVRDLALARVHTPEPYATFALSNTLAGLMLLCVPLAAGLALGRWRERRPGAALVLALAAAVCGAVLWTTGSKGAWLAGALAIGLLGAWRTRGKLRTVLLLVGILLLAGGLWRASTSLSFRLGYWAGGARMVLAHPWGGLGLGGFDSEYNRYRPVWARDVHHAHCDPLQLWVEAGLWALVGFLWLSGLCWHRAECGDTIPIHPSPACGSPCIMSPDYPWGWAAVLGASIGGVLLLFPAVLPPAYFGGSGTLRAWVGVAMVLAGSLVGWAADAAWGEGGRRGALLGVLALGIHALGDFDLSVPGVGLCGWAMLGALAAGSPGEEAPSRPGVRRSLLAVAALMAIAWGLLMAVALPALETEEVVASARELLDRDPRPLPEVERRRLRRALSRGPGSGEAWEVLARTDERTWRAGGGEGAFRAALADWAQAGIRRPAHPSSRWAQARLYLEGASADAGRAASALASADAAVLAFPTAPVGQVASARIRRRVLASAALVEAVARVWGLTPEATRARLTDEAARAYRRALALDGEILEEGQRLSPSARAEAEAWPR